MLLTDLDHAPLDLVAALAGLTPTRQAQGGLWLKPCPLCNRESAHTNTGGRPDPRGPIHLRAGFKCHGCEEGHGSRADLIALSRLNKWWRDCSREERAQLLGSEPPPPRVSLPPALDYLPAEGWEALVSVCVPAVRDPLCVEWAERRGLRLAPDLLAAAGDPVEEAPLWTKDGRWLPDFGARLVLPLSDHHGAIRGARLRDVLPRDEQTQRPKEQALRGYSAQGLCYAPWSVRKAWQAGEPYPGPCALLEGKPDQLAAWRAWGAERAVLGFLEGSFSRGAPWLAGLSGDVVMVYQEDAPDKQGKRKGVTFAERAQVLRPGLRAVGVSAVWRAAGEPWVEGEDLAALAERAKVPAWGW